MRLSGCTGAAIIWSVVTLKADSHIAYRSHVAPMPFPCLAVPLWV